MNHSTSEVPEGTLPGNTRGLAWPSACLVDQLAVRLLALSDFREHYSFEHVESILSAHGRRGNAKHNISTMQRLNGAGATYRRYFHLGNEWVFRGAAPSTGHVVWHHVEDPGLLIIDRVATQGVASLPEMASLPVVPGAQLRVCDLVTTYESRRFVSTASRDSHFWAEDPAWNPQPTKAMPTPGGQTALSLAVSA